MNDKLISIDAAILQSLVLYLKWLFGQLIRAKPASNDRVVSVCDVVCVGACPGEASS